MEVFTGICVLIAFGLAIVFFPRLTAVVLLGFFLHHVMGWSIITEMDSQTETIEIIAGAFLGIALVGVALWDLVSLIERLDKNA